MNNIDTIPRTLAPAIQAALFKGKGIILYGARQVGKTTLSQRLLETSPGPTRYLNCDEPDVRAALTDTTSTAARNYIGPTTRVVVIDEAQRVKNIGLTLKLLIDTYSDLQVIATGSSSFELANQIAEPLTGRVYEFFLPPLAIEEVAALYDSTELARLQEDHLRYGMYPEIITNRPQAATLLTTLATTYLYKDALEYQAIRYPSVIRRLIEALALQIGQEVSYNELANLVGINRLTVGRYIDILEKAFIIFRLRPLARNRRKELTKLQKIYFWDVGVRNALLNNFNPLHLRSDTGQLWENWVIAERVKWLNNHNHHPRLYFWRTHDGQEVDYVEESQGMLRGYEIKWGKTKNHLPSAWKRLYPASSLEFITPATAPAFLGY